jgi:hypothetical protein
MPASQKKIITKLRERRQIEADLQQLLGASSEQELRYQVQAIAARGGNQVIPVVLSSLDRADARMLAALGFVAALLEHEQVTTALRQVVLQPETTDRARIAAMTILERFLGEPSDDGLLANLSDPEGVAISSLEEVLQQATKNPAILIEYVQGLDRQEPDVVLAVVRALRDRASATGLDRESAIEPLRMMAQDVREEIAAAALQVLGSIRLPGAARALQMLIPISAPALRPGAERLLRKLQFAGVEVTPPAPPPAEWRALASAVDGRGQQHVWYIEADQQTAQARFLSVLLNDRAGAVEAVGHTQVPVWMLPPRRPLGHLHDVALPDGSGAMLMLEASFDLGRRLVLEALAHNRQTQIPVAGPLRLFSPWLWGYGGVDAMPPIALPGDIGPEDPDWEAHLRSGAFAGDLLDHPVFSTWMVGGILPQDAVLRVADGVSRHPNWDLEIWVKRLASDLFAGPEIAQILNRRLVYMSEWLLLAGDETAARLALIAATESLEKSPQDQAFLQALIRRDLALGLSGLGQRSESIVDPE